MAALNRVTIIGNLGKDPEVRTTPQGGKVANFSIATTERYNDKSGQRQEKTEWHNIVAWNRLAEIIEQYARKGSSMYLEGKLTTRSWDDPNGQKRYRTEIVANQMQLLGSKGDNQSQDGFQSQQAHNNTPPSDPPEYSDVPMDDDLPF